MSCTNDTKFLTAETARTSGRNNSVVFLEICGIQQAILAAIDNKKFEAIISDNTPMTSVNEIVSIVVTNGGSGYTTVSATAAITHPLGINALIEPIVVAGTVTGFTVVNGGSGYEPIVATADATGLGDGLATIQIITSGGAIVQANIITSGNTYVAGDVIPITHPNGVNGIVQVASVNINGAIMELVITNSGSGYEPIIGDVIITHPAGAGFSGIPIVTGGVITGISIISGGLGYADIKPTAEISGSGAGAILDVTMAGGIITAITVVNGGGGYDNTTLVTIIDADGGPGINATALATVDTLEYNSVQYYQVWQELMTSREITDQLDTVIKYFQKLGYNIQIEPNVITSNTIQWHLYW